MLIASRSCPACAGPLDTEGTCRACAAPEPVSSEKLIAQAEALFSSYLAARIVRARRAVKAAKLELLEDPRDREKAAAVRAAEDEAQRLQGQLVVHTRARQQADDARASVDATESATEPPAQNPAATLPTADAVTVQSTSTSHDRQCPRCGIRLPGGIAQCRCGYAFEAAASALPSMFLTAAEIAAARSSGKRR